MYCGHSFSSEFTCVTPTEPHRLPSPVNPCSLAPQGTASIFSIMARLACFFLSAANPGRAIRRVSETIIGTLRFIQASGKAFLHLQVLPSDSPLKQRGRKTLRSFSRASANRYLGLDSPTFAVLWVLNCCVDCRNVCGFSLSSSCT